MTVLGAKGARAMGDLIGGMMCPRVSESWFRAGGKGGEEASGDQPSANLGPNQAAGPVLETFAGTQSPTDPHT